MQPLDRISRLGVIGLLIAVLLVVPACGSSSGNGGLSVNSTCQDYNNADQATQNRLVQDEINSHHSSRGVADIEGYLGYNCSQNIDQKLSALLTPAHF